MKYLILILVTVLVLVSTNILAQNMTVTERDIAVLCGASEDYIVHKELCNKLYEQLKQGIIPDDPNFEYD